MAKFVITLEENQQALLLKNVLGTVHKNLSDSDVVSFFFEPRHSTIEILCGNEQQSLNFHIPFADPQFRKNFSFSVPRQYLIESSKHKSAHTPLNIAVEKMPEHFVLDVMNIDKLREYIADTTYQPHIDLRQNLSTLPFQTVSKSQLQRILYEIKAHEPLNFVEHNHFDKTLKVQQGDVVQKYSLPNDLEFPISFTFNNFALENLTTTISQAKSNDIELLMHDNKVSFRCDDVLITHCLDGLDTFQQQHPQTFENELTMIVDIYTVKNEIDAYFKSYAEIQQANINYLLIHEKELTLCAYTDHNRNASQVTVHEIVGTDEAQLYLVDLAEFRKVKIKDLTSAEQMKIAVLKSPSGERKLAFYHYRSPIHPYATIKLGSMPHELPTILAAKSRLKAKQQESKASKAKSAQQSDMFGFEDL